MFNLSVGLDSILCEIEKRSFSTCSWTISTVTTPQQTKETQSKRRFLPRALRFFLSAIVILSLIIVGLSVLYRFVPPSYSALMLWRMASGVQTDYRWRPLDRISDNLAYAVIASEDGRFCRHNGVDWLAVETVWEDFQRSGNNRPRGASTIPMQVARNLFLWPSRNYLRKALEVPIAYWLDMVWTKRRMIEIYLNIVEWGPGIYGAEAASQFYFGHNAANLNPSQAALLAAALPNPIARNPARPSRKLRRLAYSVQKRLRAIRGRAACIFSN